MMRQINLTSPFAQRVRGLLRNVFQHHLGLYAAALTYLTLFALVPLLSVSYSVISALPVSTALADTAQQLLLKHLLPNSSDQVLQQLNDFSLQARQLTGLSIAGLLLTGFFLLRQMELAFDHIWHHPHARRTWISLLSYWAMLSLGPVLIAAGIAITSWAMSLHWLAEGPLHQWLGWPVKFAPWLLSLAAFTLVYKLVPSRPVKWLNSLAGAAAAATLFELAKWGFGWATARSSYGFIYGAFAAVPLFLLWIHTSWMILLVGAEIVALDETVCPAPSAPSGQLD